MKVISLGAGVQSTTLVLLAIHGEIERPDFAVFADTGWEPKAVYDHLALLKAYAAERNFDIRTVSIGSLRDDAINPDKSQFASMPLFTKDEKGGKSMLRRQCTREYKIAPIQKLCRELGATSTDPAELWIGISSDEVHRMKDPFVRYMNNRWPLIEMRWSRQMCRKYLDDHGWTVPKSSCIGCPFHDDHYWLRMKRDSPVEFQDAIDFDRAIRKMPRLTDETFIHHSATPLESVNFGEDQKDFDFGDECGGYCGV